MSMALGVSLSVAFLTLCFLCISADALGKRNVGPRRNFHVEEEDKPTIVLKKSIPRRLKNRTIPAHLLDRILSKPATHQVALIELGPSTVANDGDVFTPLGQGRSHRVQTSEKFSEFEDVFAYRREHPPDKGNPWFRCPMLDAIQEPSKSVELTDREPELWVLPGYGFEGLVVSLISNLYEARNDIVSAIDLGIVDHCHWNHLKLATFQQTWTYPDTWGVKVVVNNHSYYINSSLSWWSNFFRGYRLEAVCRRCAISMDTPAVCTPPSQTTLGAEEVRPETTTSSGFETESFSRPVPEHASEKHWQALPIPTASRETPEAEVIHREELSPPSPPPFWVWVGPLIACLILSAALVITCALVAWVKASSSNNRTHPVLETEEGEQGDCSSTVFACPESEISQSTTPLT